MKLVVGLGNPGPKYTHTRHNLGADLVRMLVADANGRWQEKEKLQARVAELPEIFPDVLFALPNVFMNKSGLAVKALVDHYKCVPADMVIVHDELESSFGRVSTKDGGSAGGHNGLRSIMASLDSDAFKRVRIGISRPFPKGEGPEDAISQFVLQKFSPEEQAKLPSVLTAAKNTLKQIIS